jgi:hypothetical protein
VPLSPVFTPARAGHVKLHRDDQRSPVYQVPGRPVDQGDHVFMACLAIIFEGHEPVPRGYKLEPRPPERLGWMSFRAIRRSTLFGALKAGAAASQHQRSHEAASVPVLKALLEASFPAFYAISRVLDDLQIAGGCRIDGMRHLPATLSWRGYSRSG